MCFYLCGLMISSLDRFPMLSFLHLMKGIKSRRTGRVKKGNVSPLITGMCRHCHAKPRAAFMFGSQCYESFPCNAGKQQTSELINYFETILLIQTPWKHRGMNVLVWLSTLRLVHLNAFHMNTVHLLCRQSTNFDMNSVPNCALQFPEVTTVFV